MKTILLKKEKLLKRGTFFAIAVLVIAIAAINVSKVFAADALTTADYIGIDGDPAYAGFVNSYCSLDDESLTFKKVSEAEFAAPNGTEVAELNNDGNLKAYRSGKDVFIITTCDKIKIKSDCDCLFGSMSLYGLKRIEGLDMLDTSEVSTMSGWFCNLNKLESLDLKGFNTEKVEYMDSMFYGCEMLKTVDLSSFDVEIVCDFSYMFDGCKSLETLDLSNFNTESAETFSYMFRECISLKSLDVSSFDVTDAEEMTSMFCDCKSLDEIDLRSFGLSNRENLDISHMFEDCENLKTIMMPYFSASKKGFACSGLFNGCHNLKYVDMVSLDFSQCGKSEDCGNMFCQVNDCTFIVGTKFVFNKNFEGVLFPAHVDGVKVYYFGDDNNESCIGSFMDCDIEMINMSEWDSEIVIDKNSAEIHLLDKNGGNDYVYKLGCSIKDHEYAHLSKSALKRGAVMAYLSNIAKEDKLYQYGIDAIDSIGFYYEMKAPEDVFVFYDENGEVVTPGNAGKYTLEIRFKSMTKQYSDIVLTQKYEIMPIKLKKVTVKDQTIKNVESELDNSPENVTVEGIWPDEYVSAVEFELDENDKIGIKKLTILQDKTEYDVSCNYYFDDVLEKGNCTIQELADMKNINMKYDKSLLVGKNPEIKINGLPEGAKVTYSLDGKTFTEDMPKLAEPGTYKVIIKIEKRNYNTFTDTIQIAIEPYEILEGKSEIWTEGLGKTLVVRGNGEIADFIKILVDGEEVDASNYTVTEGSTIITFKDAYLKALKEGKHSLEIVWTYGSAKTDFTTKLSGDIPADNAAPIALAAMLLVSAAAVLITMKRKITE